MVGLWWCDDGSDEQTFVWDKTGSKHISTPYDGHHLCLDNSGATANGSPITAQDCSSKALAQQAFMRGARDERQVRLSVVSTRVRDVPCCVKNQIYGAVQWCTQHTD